MKVEQYFKWTGPIPTTAIETEPFWNACNQDQFLVQKCRDCGEVQYHYRAMCCHCWSDAVDDLPIAGTAKIWTLSVVEVNRSAQFAEWGVYATGVVELPEGVKVITRILAEDVHALKIGDDVTLAFAVAPTGQKVPVFVAMEPSRENH